MTRPVEHLRELLTGGNSHARQLARQAHSETIPEDERWNGNIHYFPELLALAPAERALDVGCGEGILTRRLARSCQSVVGIDPDAPSITLARETTEQANVDYVIGDVLTHDFESESFDLVVAVLMLHHVDAHAGLQRFRDLVRPGGRVGIIGIGDVELPRGLPAAAVRGLASRGTALTKRKQMWAHSAPIVWPPPHTDAGYRRIAKTILPGCTFNVRLLNRHTITWTKPTP